MNPHSANGVRLVSILSPLGQESMAFGYGLHVAAADFPADAFLSRGNRNPTRAKPGIRIIRNTDAHEG